MFYHLVFGKTFGKTFVGLFCIFRLNTENLFLSQIPSNPPKTKGFQMFHHLKTFLFL